MSNINNETEINMTTENQLVTIEKKNALELFTNKNGLDPVISNIREMIDNFEGDTSTVKGRSEIASMAHSVARSKTYLDNIGKDLVSKLKEQPKLVDAERKRIRDLLDEWKEEVRKPLTKLEEAEKEVVNKLDSYLETDELSAAEINAWLKDAESIDVSFAVIKPKDLEAKKESVVSTLTKRFEKQQAFEKQQQELEQARIAEEQRLAKEREEQLKREAAEAARIEAEQKAKREREEEDRQRQEKERQANLEQQERERKAAEEKAAAERREAELLAQAEAAERRAEEAAEAERKRYEQQRQAEEDAQRKAAANKQHRKKVNNEILGKLVESGFSEEDAKKVITLAAKGEAGRLVVNY